MRRSGRRVANDDHVGVHGVEGVHGVAQGFTLRRARGRTADVHDVCRQTLAGEFEASARARGRFEEDVDDGLAAQRGNLAHRAARYFQEGVREVEQAFGGVAVEVVDAEQVADALLCHLTSGRGAPGGMVGELLDWTTAWMPAPFANTSMRSSLFTVSVFST